MAAKGKASGGRAEAPALGPPGLTCYKAHAEAPPLEPGRPERGWMDLTNNRFAYRCTPLTIANSSGWELRLPVSFSATWFGGPSRDDLHILPRDDDAGRTGRLVASHFGHGVLTFHTGWLFRTPPGWAVWARGAPNQVKDGIVPLDGLVETDWLPFPFTMNWRFTRPGKVVFDKGEIFCFIMLVAHQALDSVEPRLASLDDDSQLKRDFEAWSASRANFNERLAALEPEAVAQGWQRGYVQGKAPGPAPAFHLSKRRLKTPK